MCSPAARQACVFCARCGCNILTLAQLPGVPFLSNSLYCYVKLQCYKARAALSFHPVFGGAGKRGALLLPIPHSSHLTAHSSAAQAVGPLALRRHKSTRRNLHRGRLPLSLTRLNATITSYQYMRYVVLLSPHPKPRSKGKGRQLRHRHQNRIRLK